MFLGPAGRICDPLSAVIVGLFIVVVSFRIGKPAVAEMLEIALPEKELHRIAAAVSSTRGVGAFHRLRTRRSGANVIVELHIKVDPRLTVEEAHDIATRVENSIGELYGRDTSIVTVHVEPYYGKENKPDETR